jgi:hypothetical protein
METCMSLQCRVRQFRARHIPALCDFILARIHTAFVITQPHTLDLLTEFRPPPILET